MRYLFALLLDIHRWDSHQYHIYTPVYTIWDNLRLFYTPLAFVPLPRLVTQQLKTNTDTITAKLGLCILAISCTRTIGVKRDRVNDVTLLCLFSHGFSYLSGAPDNNSLLEIKFKYLTKYSSSQF